jgi:hypothetical protein
MPVSYRTNCVYYFNAFTISMVHLTIIPTTFPDLVYAIGEPLASYTLTPFSLNHPAYANNPRFTILYELIDAGTGLAPNIPVSNFLLNLDNTLRSFDLQSYSVSISLGIYNFKWRAKFADYNPTYCVELPFQLTLTTPCGDNPIGNLNAPATMYHLIEEMTPTVASWSLWTVKRFFCVTSFVYSLLPVMTEITPNWNAGVISVTGKPGMTSPALI